MSRMGRRLLLAVGIAWLWFAVAPEESYACMREPETPVAEIVTDSDLAFQGTVVSFMALDRNWAEVEFEVTTFWKGQGPATITLKSYWAEDADCTGIFFAVGEEWVVLARDGVIDARDGGTSLLRRGEAVLALLDSAHQVREEAAYPNAGSGGLTAESQSRIDWLEASVVAGLMLVVTSCAVRTATRLKRRTPRSRRAG